MPARLKAAVGVAVGAGALTAALTVVLGGHHGIGSVAELVGFMVALGFSWAFPIKLLRREETEAFQLDEAFLVAMALLLPPGGVVLAFGIGAFVSRLVTRRPLVRVAFNTGMVVTAAGLAVGAARLVGGPSGAHPRGFAGVILGAAVFLIVNAVSVSAVMAVVEGQPFWGSLADGLGFRLLVWAATVAIGLLAGLAGSAYTWALLFAALPMGVLQIVLSGSLRAAPRPRAPRRSAPHGSRGSRVHGAGRR